MKRYVLTVALNAAVDVAYVVPGFGVDQINTAAETLKAAGGKANNVARVLARLGGSVVATGFAGGGAGRFIQDDLARNSITAEYEPIDGESRTCMAITDPEGRTLTELREKGPILGPADAERFGARYERLLAGADLVVISGSIPPGIASRFYGDLVARARARQVPAILDCSGQALREALPARPFLVKPNREELAEWAGVALGTDGAERAAAEAVLTSEGAEQAPAEAVLTAEDAVLAAARRMLAAGPERVLVSLGAEGMLLVTPTEVWRAVPPPVAAVNTVGSGDSAVAGVARGFIRGDAVQDWLRLAVACGTANALTQGVAEVNPADVERIQQLVRVERLS